MSILNSIFQAIMIIVESAIKTSMKIIALLFHVSGEFGTSASTMSTSQLIMYAVIIFVFVVIILKFLGNSLKSLLYFGLILLFLWLFFL